MKKLVLTIIAAALLLDCAQARGNFQIGAGAATNIFLYKEKRTAELPITLSGVQAYASYEYRFNRTLGLAAGVRLSDVGLLERHSASYGAQANVRSWNKLYVEVPLMFAVHIWKGIFFTVGPVGEFAAAYSMKDTRKDSGAVLNTETKNLFSAYSDGRYSRFNLDVEAQLGYDFERIRLYAGYKYDFFNVYKLGDNSCKMMQVQLGLAVRF
ncbi:MAG: PorT family protein [Bacteroidales bacterium]|nr:PorT family protein [Candidatus Cacconaster caballi]